MCKLLVVQSCRYLWMRCVICKSNDTVKTTNTLLVFAAWTLQFNNRKIIYPEKENSFMNGKAVWEHGSSTSSNICEIYFEIICKSYNNYVCFSKFKILKITVKVRHVLPPPQKSKQKCYSLSKEQLFSLSRIQIAMHIYRGRKSALPTLLQEN